MSEVASREMGLLAPSSEAARDSRARQEPPPLHALGSLAIMTATFNEAGNIGPLLEQLHQVAPRARILVVDDSSQDGTAEILKERSAGLPELEVLSRSGKLGIGSAHKDIRWANAQGIDTLVTLDADFTHLPADIPGMLQALEEDAARDLVIGTRFERADSLTTWSWQRRLLTRAGHLATRLLLGLPYDCSGSFRAYRLDRVPESLWSGVKADDYGFFFESLHALHAAGHRIHQVPIVLPARASGSSKMSLHDALGGLSHLVAYAWDVRRRIRG